MNDSMRLLIAGDFCSYFPSEITVSNELKQVITSHSIRIVNFEGPLNVGQKHTASTFYLKQSEESPKWCTNNGFNLINLANNHAYDFGETGLKATEKSFHDAITIGCGSWDEAYSIKTIVVNEKKIGFFSATSADLASLKDKWTDKNKYGCPWINQIGVNNLIENAKKQLDFLIVIVHAGVEYMDVPLPEWRDRYYDLIDKGADAIIGMHPHVPQGFEYYKSKPIFYSLGNFCFYKGIQKKYPENWNNGILASLELKQGKIEVNAIQTTLNLESKEIEIDTSEIAVQRLNKLNSYLYDEEKYIERVNQFCLDLHVKYEGWLLQGLQLCKIHPFNFKVLYHLLRYVINGNVWSKRIALHQLREESTRYVLARAYKLLSKTDL